jgi:hypothetical protein
MLILALTSEATQQQVAVALDVQAISAILAFFVPLVVNLISKQKASDGLKAMLNVLLTAVVAVIAFALDPGVTTVSWVSVVNVFAVSLVASFTAYKAVWKPTGISGSIAAATSGFGLGSPPTLETSQKGEEDLGQIDMDPQEGTRP